MQKRLDGVISVISRGVPVLTVNARLSRYLQSEFDVRMKASGLSSWMTPLILPLNAWLSALWEEHMPDEPLLNGARAQALWERIVSDDKELPEAGLYSSGAAGMAFEAYRLIKEYGVKLPEEIYLTNEAKALKRWIKAYEHEVKRLGFADRFSLPQKIAVLIKARRIPVPKEVALAGFDELTPSVASIIASLKGSGVKASFWPEGEGAKGKVSVRAYGDEAEEVIQAARWVRGLPEGSKAGIIVPELNRYREIIKREFSAELDPASVLPSSGKKAIFNISLGSSLYDEPLVRSALEILSIGGGREDIDKLASAFRPPFFLNERDYFTFSRLDLELREDNCLRISLYEIKKRAGFGADLNKRLELWLKGLKESGKKALPGFWAHNLSKFLKDLGWLSPVKLNSAEFQALKAWNSLLEGFAALDDILGKISRSEAVSRLRGMARDAMHQPETPECRVQVLGLLESAGLFFDYIWLLGCHEFAVPAQPSPNPFIPIFLQKEYRLPRSSHDRELWFAKEALARIMASAPHIEVSFPMRADEKELKASPLFKGCEATSPNVKETSRLKDAVHAEFSLEEIEEGDRIPVTPEEKKSIRGGTSIIKNQSICPFKAFATHRLNAGGIAVPELGLSYAKRGTILHTAMKLFWEKAEGSKKLREMIGAGEMDGYIKGIAGKALKGIDLYPLSEEFIAIERERLEALIKDWVALELERGPFRVKVTELEKKIDAGGLIITGRIDRVDEDESGREIVIDYKTGDVKADWLSERPEEPQLFIYSVTGKYDAISFARVAPGECRFVGVSRSDLLPGVKGVEGNEDKFKGMEWERLMDFWRSVIEGLGRDFIEGVCAIDPAQTKNQPPCGRCGLTTLCRIDEIESGSDGDEN
ncbi:MAG: PD-(D/E)XK nuclease family protein [Deltaproteobacteria bacterium]|nr:PD-(D/E)XK nuclease family protein [Deltaproteobacteria bacterium]